MDSKNLKVITDLQTVEAELLTLAPRLMPMFRNNVTQAARLVNEAIETVRIEASRKEITLLTFDAEAGMAYFHLVPPGTAESVRTLEHVFAESEFTATTDHAADGTPIGAEFPARTPEEALARGAMIAAAFA